MIINAKNRCCEYERTFSLNSVNPFTKAELFKIWLAQVGNERLEETVDPEIAIDRALETYF